MPEARRVFNPAGFGIGLREPESGAQCAIRVCDKPPGARPLRREQENCMSRFTRFLTLGLFSVALVAAPVVSKVYAAPDNDPPPPSDSKKKKKKSEEVRPGIEDTVFANGYRAAYSAIYDRGEYASAIEQLKALRPRRQRRRRQSDRLLLSQARRLQGLADLVRARAEGRPEPRQDLAVLRPVAGRTGQPRPGAISPEPDRRPSRHRAAKNIARSPRHSKSRRAPGWSTDPRTVIAERSDSNPSSTTRYGLLRFAR